MASELNMKQIILFAASVLIFVAFAASNQIHATNTSPSLESDDQGCLDPNAPKPQTISLGRLNSRAVDIPKPAYPIEAKDARVSGVVTAQVVVDESGKVIWARVRTGPELLQAAVKTVVCQALLKPFKLNGNFVKTNGIITYKFELP
jgi:TonB family protein